MLLGLDGVSGKPTSLLLDVLTEGALLVIYGYISGEPFTPDQTMVQPKHSGCASQSRATRTVLAHD